MRILLHLTPEKDYSFDLINKYNIQSLIYKLLKNSPFDVLHDLKGFKYFTFSDIMPPTSFKEGEKKYMVISSPSSPFIKYLKSKLEEVKTIKLKDLELTVEVKKIPDKLPKEWITASPIVVKYGKNEYYSFYKGRVNIFDFLERLKDLALKKYNSYYNENLYFEGPLFDVMKFSKSVSVKITKKDRSFIVIGSMWRLLKKYKIDKELEKFYKFTFDVGLGEKNSLGFGCLNEKIRKLK